MVATIESTSPAGAQPPSNARPVPEHEDARSAGEPRYGASPEEWKHFAEALALRDDLLPVVSNPSAPIAPDSTLEQLGKTPSRYDRQRRVWGIKKWNEKVITE